MPLYDELTMSNTPTHKSNTPSLAAMTHDEISLALLRGLIGIGDTVTPENLSHNFRNLSEGFRSGFFFLDPENTKLWNLIRSHVTEHDEAPSIEVLRNRIGDDLLLREQLADIEYSRVFIKSNYKALVTQAASTCVRATLRQVLKDTNDALNSNPDDPRRVLPLIKEKLAQIEAMGSSSKKLAIKSARDIFSPLTPIRWLCPELRLAPGGVSMFSGYGFSGKTLFAQELVLSVASGQKLLGRFAVTRGRALHVDFEQGDHLTKERYQRIAAARGLDTNELIAGDHFGTIHYPPTYLDAPDAEAIFEETFRGYTLVVIDSLKASTPSTEENSSSVRIPLDILARLSERLGITIVVIDHARKPREDATGGAKMAIRGNSAKFDALTTSYVFSGDKGKPTRVMHEKCRHRGVLLDDFGFMAVDVPEVQVIDTEGNAIPGVRIDYLDSDKLDETSEAVDGERLRPLENKIASYLSTLDDQTFEGTRDDLRSKVSAKNTTFVAALHNMENSGRVTISRSRPPRIKLCGLASSCEPPRLNGHAMAVDLDDTMTTLLNQAG